MIFDQLISENFGFQNMLATVTTGHSASAIADTLVQTFGISHQAALSAIENFAMYASMGPLVKPVGGGSGTKGGTESNGSGNGGAKGMQSIIEPKIAQQMVKRGWTTDSLESVIANPSETVVTKDTRFDPVSGTRLNDPATGYVAKDGSYVVRNDRTGAIVQVSDKNDKNWVAPWE
ncbi:colicin E5-related ribonuclease [Pseudomonas sp. SZMC_28357]|uniref:colicin E5-related ribonuclease n=1 Tax=Pseudomonas sp. SZMC_28357 TaxID=3074380 RepID=UPI002871FB81|nr:colicin E5-related ribonuclease [Pseudomonas sp. SZMC_28357]MDR9754694.1 colicin E5-related ribonuclease [Pseudomonas sp. SZMC_28357]